MHKAWKDCVKLFLQSFLTTDIRWIIQSTNIIGSLFASVLTTVHASRGIATMQEGHFDALKIAIYI